jgi:HSP20 family protein
MNLVTWKPFEDFMSMPRRMNRLFGDTFFKDFEKETDTLSQWYPATDIYETKDDYVFKLEVPGLKKEDINIEFNDNTLSIKGERKEEREVKKEDYHRIESCSGIFSRSFSLPNNIDPKKINATMKNGVLELRVAKAEEKKPKAITIN